jgi:hypothetical protein
MNWINKSMTKMQCNPAVFLIVGLVLLGAVFVAERQLVLVTALKTVIVIAIGCAGAGVVMLVRALVTSRRAQGSAPAAALPELPKRHEMTLEQEADHLAHPEVSLVLSPAGRIEQR